MKNVNNLKLLESYIRALTKEIKCPNNIKAFNDRRKLEIELLKRLDVNEKEFYSLVF